MPSPGRRWRRRFSHFPLYHPEHRDAGLEPHYVGEQYFFAKTPQDANKAVDISAYIERKIEALCQHVSQMEMTVAGLQVDLAASGLEVPALRDADPKDYRPVVEAMIRTWAAGVGRRHGMAFAEEFRRQRFGGIERWARESGELPDL